MRLLPVVLCLQANGMADSAQVGHRLAGPSDEPMVIQPGSSKRRSFFGRRHKKTPSSPGRLMTPRMSDSSMTSHGSVSDADTSTTSSQFSSKDSMSNLELAAKLLQDGEGDCTPVVMRSKHMRGQSADGSHGLKRGRPNTVTSGLPVDRYKPSPNRSRHSIDNAPPPRQSSQRDIFNSPEICIPLECDGGVIDTSPIPMAEPLVHDLSPVSMANLDDDEEDDDEDHMDDQVSLFSSNTGDDASILSRQVSDASLGLDDRESGLDQAFIVQEITMCGENSEEHKPEAACNSQSEDVFKKPMGLPVAMPKKKEPLENVRECENKLNSSVQSDASDTSIITVIFNGQPVPSRNPIIPTPFCKPAVPPKCAIKPKQKDISVTNEEKQTLSSSVSVNSIDSAIDAGTEGNENKFTKSDSRHSLKSCDSGMGGDVEMEQAESNGYCQSLPQPTAEQPCFKSQAILRLKNTESETMVSQPVGAKVTRHASFLKETANPVMLKKRANAERRRSADPCLQVSAGMHHMLSRVGVVSDAANWSRAPFVAVHKNQEEANDSIVNLQKAGKVTASLTKFDPHTSPAPLPPPDYTQRELAARRASPLRFPNSVSRRVGVSPVRIPTIFAKADKEAAKYREIAKVAMRSPRSVKLPISTSLVRSAAVENAKQRLGNSPDVKSDENNTHECCTPNHHLPKDESAGHTPMKLSAVSKNPALQSIEINTSLLDTINEICTPKSEKLAKQIEGLGVNSSKRPLKDCTNTDNGDSDPHATPKIKPAMISGRMVGTNLLTKNLCGITVSSHLGTTPSRKYRSPVKPVKRLQGSPHSPRSPMSPRNLGKKSPHKTHPSGGKPASPIPAHVTEWGF